MFAIWLRPVVVAVFVASLLSSFFSLEAKAGSVVGPDWATKVVLYNASNADVVCIITLGKHGAGTAPIQDGCPSNVNQLKTVDLTANGGPTNVTAFTTSATGWFMLKRGRQVQLYSTSIDPRTKQQSWCLSNVVFGFNGQGSICPLANNPVPNTNAGSSFNRQINGTTPNGTNGAELTINVTGFNNSGQVAGASNESIDLTCLSGANSRIGMTVTPPPGGPYWSYNGGPRAGGNRVYTTSVYGENSWVKIVPNSQSGCDDNCVDPRTGLPRILVFPYGCSICNAFPDPGPACTTGGYNKQFCATKNNLPQNNGCGMARTPLQTGTYNVGGAVGLRKFGGTIQITYLGPISPPSRCP